MSVCVTINEKDVQKAIAIASRFRIAEIRLDLCGYDSESIQKIFSSHANLIATYRPNESHMPQRVDDLKHAIDSGASWIDIEFEMEGGIRELMIQYAKERDVKIIISYHNWDRTEGMEELKAIVENSFKMGADYVKLAARVNEKEDAIRILQLYAEYSNLIAFGIGEQAKFTRMASVLLGAPHTYVYTGPISNQLAEGQLSEDEYMGLMKILGPSSHL